MVCLQEPEKATGTDQKLRKVPQRESEPDGKNDDTMRQEMEKPIQDISSWMQRLNIIRIWRCFTSMPG